MIYTRKLALITTGIAMLALSGCFKATGGGWMEDGDGDLVNFGFTAQPDGEPTGFCDGYFAPFPTLPTCQPAKGRFTLIDHGNVSGEARMIRGDFTGTFNSLMFGDPIDGSQFNGTVMIDGEEWLLGMRVSDYGEGGGIENDFVFIMLEKAATADGSPDLVYIGNIGGGNIQVHAK